MPSELILPELGENITSGVVVKILVKKGDPINKGDPVIEIETDKAVVEVPSDTSGVVTELHVKEGQQITVGQLIVTLEPGPEETGTSPEQKKAEPEKAAIPEPEPLHRAVDKPAENEPTDVGKPLPRSQEIAPAAPSVRRFAREIGIRINDVPGTGPGGRISKEDVKRYSKNRHRQEDGARKLLPGVQIEPLPDFTKWGGIRREPMSMVRQKTAAHLAWAWSAIPHVTQFDKADMTQIEAFRKAYGKTVEAAGGKLTVTAILLKIVSTALTIFPKFNASVDMEKQEIIYKDYVNVGVAVDTYRGLLVPVLHQVDQKSITGLCVELSQLAELARTRKLPLEKMQGGNFTISNLGGIGGVGFTPIIHSPEVAILGVSRGQVEMVHENGEFEPRLMVPLSLSYDHRIIDGADGARFLRWIVQAIEQPLLLSLDG